MAVDYRTDRILLLRARKYFRIKRNDWRSLLWRDVTRWLVSRDVTRWLVSRDVTRWLVSRDVTRGGRNA